MLTLFMQVFSKLSCVLQNMHQSLQSRGKMDEAVSWCFWVQACAYASSVLSKRCCDHSGLHYHAVCMTHTVQNYKGKQSFHKVSIMYRTLYT